MPEKFLVPVYLPNWLHEPLRKAKRAFIPQATAEARSMEEEAAVIEPRLTIHGERNVEWAFLSAEMPNGPGEALEFGCENGYMSLMAAQKGFRVVAVDLEEQPFLWRHPGVEFRQGDFLKMKFPRDHYDLIVNCSSVEHVGIAGRYGICVEESDGDIQVMQRFAEILKPGGMLLMSAPCGRDAVVAPWHRVYGRKRLPKILADFEVIKEAYWMKDEANRWTATGRDEALDLEPWRDSANPYNCLYALSCFVLRKKPRS